MLIWGMMPPINIQQYTWVLHTDPSDTPCPVSNAPLLWQERDHRRRSGELRLGQEQRHQAAARADARQTADAQGQRR